jgi:hypothetical protein
LSSALVCLGLLGRCDGAIAGCCALATSGEYDDQNDDYDNHDNGDPNIEK